MESSKILTYATALLCLASCTKDRPSLPEAKGLQHIMLEVGIDEQTKGSPVTDMASIGAISLYGYMYAGSWGASCTPNYMNGEKVSYASSKWSSEGLYNGTVASGSKVRLLAYAPYGASGVSVPAGQSGPLGFSYTTPSDVRAQSDLLAGSSAELTGKVSPAPMTFRHILSAVTFRTGSETVTGTVKSISVIGVYSQAGYTVGSGWSGHASPASFSAQSGRAVTEGSARDLTDGDLTMMLIPQTTPSGARIEVVVSSDGEDHVLSAPIGGSLWEEGKTYTYSLSFDSIAGMHIDVTPASCDVGYGTHADFTITGDPGWSISTTGSGFSAVKVSETTLRVTGSNYTGVPASGTVTLTTGDGRRSATVAISSASLQESISLSPTAVTIEYGSTATLSATGTFPGGFGVTDLSGVAESISGSTVSLKNETPSYTAVSGLTLKATTNLMGKMSNGVTVNLKARPETISMDRSSLSIENAGSGSVTLSGDFDSYSAELSSTQYATLSRSGRTLTITNGNDTYEDRTVTLTCTTGGDTGASATCTVNLAGKSDYVTGYVIEDITLSSTSVGAGGGTVTVSGGGVTQVWASGRTVSGYASATISCPGATVSGTSVTVGGAGASEGDTTTYTVTASYSVAGFTVTSRTATFTRGSNAIVDDDYNASDGDWKVSCSIGGGMTAAGGSATVTASASHTHTYYRLYSSGSTDGPHTRTVTDTPTLKIVTNGNGRFSLSGSTLSHSGMGTEVTTDDVTVRATNSAHTSTTADASKSISNAVTGRTEGSDSNHTRSGDVSYGEKSYGETVYSEKSYGSEYAGTATYGSWAEVGRAYQDSWEQYDTHTEDGAYAISTGVANDEIFFRGTIRDDPKAFIGSPAVSQHLTITASHTRTSYSDQRDKLIVHSQRSVTTPYYKDWTRTASKPYSRTASQECSYTHAYTLTYTSGATSDHTEELTHTESWTDTGSDAATGDSGTEHTRDGSSTEDDYTQDGYRYRSVATGTSTIADTPSYEVSGNWIQWNSITGALGVSANTNEARRSGALRVTNGTTTATIDIHQAGRPVTLILRNWNSSYKFWSFEYWTPRQEGTDHEMGVMYNSYAGYYYVQVEAGNLFYIENIGHDFSYGGSTWAELDYVPIGNPGASADIIL